MEEQQEKTKPKAQPRVQLEELPSGVHLLRLGSEDERVVTLTAERMASLKEALNKVKAASSKGLILTGPSASMFTAGADINAIQGLTDPVVAEELAKEGQSVYSLLEELPCTTVAAISGPCVGGGCEMVLACNYRIITEEPGSVIGLPEVKIGILPGFGGTQRLPRLVGLRKSLDIILAGKVLKPRQALSCGLVNQINPYDKLISTAENICLKKIKPSTKGISLLDKILAKTSFGRNFVKKSASKKLRKQTRGNYPAPPAALETVLYGLEKGKARGYEREAKELGRLLVTPECKALVRLFFLTEESKGIGKSAKDLVTDLTAVVVGAGVMGAGIAGIMARKDYRVILQDTTEKALARGREQISNFLGKIRYLSESDKSFILNRIETTVGESPNVSNADFAIEAIFEDLKVKKEVLGSLAAKMPDNAIITTNTSSLSVSAIAEGIPHPERVAGMHFFNPVPKMPLVEVILGKKTDDKTVSVLCALATKLGKFPIVAQDVPGFLVNRILTPYLYEAAYLLVDGYSVLDIDNAALKFGMPMGPIRLLDEVGLDIAYHVSEVMFEGYGARMKGPPLVKTLLDAEMFGKKSGCGFYDYSTDTEVPSEKAFKLLDLKRNRDLGDEKVVLDRLLMSLINEAVLCLDEGVAGEPGQQAANQVDLGTVMGMGFPPFRGGLLYYANSLGAKSILSTLNHLNKQHGDRFQPCEGIIQRAKSDKTFFQSIA